MKRKRVLGSLINSLKRSLENNNDMTIVVNKRTKIENISECPFNYKAPIKQFKKISEINSIPDFTLISIIGKVHIRSEQIEVKVQERSVMKLDCNVADDTSAIKLTLWDKNIALVQEGQVYEIVNARVRSFQGEKYLSANFDTIITGVKSDVRHMTFVSQLMENEESLSLNTIIVNQIAGVQEIPALFNLQQLSSQTKYSSVRSNYLWFLWVKSNQDRIRSNTL